MKTPLGNVEFYPGGMGPDALTITMPAGPVVVIGEEGVEVYRSAASYGACEQPAQTVDFAALNPQSAIPNPQLA